MRWERDLPDPSATAAGVLVVEAARGRSRRRAMEEWAAGAEGAGAAAWVLPCDIGQGGLWAGTATLLEALLPAVERHAPELLDEHALSLAAVLPALGSHLEVRETLTESSVGVEAVRNYALDRAYRIPHGLVDFLDALFARAPVPAARVIVCDDYDRAGSLVRRFFEELVRRRGRAFGLTLALVVEPGAGDGAAARFAPFAAVRRVRLDVPRDPPAPRSRAETTALASELEALIKDDMAGMEVRVPELIHLWLESEHPENAWPLQAYALGRYNHRGFYEDALAYTEPVLANLDSIVTGKGYFTRWNLVGSIFGCLVAAGQVERAQRVMEDEALARITEPTDRARVCYVMAMLHARFLPKRDPEKAEAYLLEGLALLDSPDITPEYRNFLRVFLNNGMALVRHRQGRLPEAIELCQDGYDDLTANMPADSHRLHRSVLLYNIARVYTGMGENEKAVEYFTATMEMDPNYSEYYNERGNVFLRMNRLDDAVRDYREAIRLSPPYPEVWTNLGQCFRKMGKPGEALAAYSRALDLDPAIVLARGARAQLLTALGRADEAMADYDLLLAQNPAQPVVLANRAALRYGAGRLAESVEDLDRAIELAPEHPGFRRNRAVGLAELDRPDEAARDLEKYLELVPAAPDRAAVEARIAALQGRMAAA
ncbi:MAG TPA: tetratricopeptide repeat protein [Longimicrobium sp.]|nr:tetratricopeptide repeat protein [Longimicrobium sp.]